MEFEARIQALLAQAQAAPLATQAELEDYKRRFTGKKGAIAELFATLKEVSADQKAALGQALNHLKTLAEARYVEAEALLKAQQPLADQPADLTLPGTLRHTGGRHPLRRVERQIVGIFQRIGFSVADGPEVEDDWHNFGALNFPPEHPARDMQDTFFVTEDKSWLLRTHTSTVQIRALEAQQPPLRLLMPGRVYRNEAISARAHCFFHQIEGLVVDEGISFADMKQTLSYFVTQLFGPGVQTRLRPSYFPFTEISAEMDVSCRVCGGAGCTVCKHSGWVEILGCGMVDPQVLRNVGLDPERYSGFAFGMGVERCAQLLYRVPDLRLYSQNDLRFLQQFAQLSVSG